MSETRPVLTGNEVIDTRPRIRIINDPGGPMGERLKRAWYYVELPINRIDEQGQAITDAQTALDAIYAASERMLYSPDPEEVKIGDWLGSESGNNWINIFADIAQRQFQAQVAQETHLSGGSRPRTLDFKAYFKQIEVRFPADCYAFVGIH